MSGLPVTRWGRPDAPPVLLLHGFLGRGADWAPVADALAGAFRLLAPDLPGHGAAADLPPEACTMDAAADALVALLDAEGAPRPTVAGYSMGGRLALHLAVRHPGRVRALALVSASPGLPTDAARTERRALDAARAAELAADLPGFLERWYRMPLFSSLTDAQRAALVADRAAHTDPTGLARSLAGMGTGAQPWHGEHLHALRVPVLAVAGAADAKFADLARRMAAAPSATAHLIPDAGHALLTEAPDALAAALAAFFRAGL